VTPTEDEREMDDFNEAGEFAPPSSAEAALNPPTESDEAPGAVVQHVAPPQQRDAARPEMPLTPVTEPGKPARSEAQRLEEDGTLIQPRDTAENEFQSGEHVAYIQPTQGTPPPTVTTGEGMGEGVEPMDPQKKEVLDTTAAPHQPQSQSAIDPSRPDVADDVLNDRESPEVASGIAGTDTISPTPATGPGQDDLTVISGVGRKMAAALRAAGIDSYTKLAAASDDDLRKAVAAGGMRLAPSLSTWRQQAGFLARGDRAGFDALKNATKGQTVEQHEDTKDEKRTNFIDPGRN
jgi:predicted flap endonuclease-1-like 5' DNA nuclease